MISVPAPTNIEQVQHKIIGKKTDDAKNILKQHNFCLRVSIKDNVELSVDKKYMLNRCNVSTENDIITSFLGYY
jgi:hypothetical protein